METDRYQYNYYHKATIFQAALLSLSVFVLICLLADAVFYLPPEMARLISIYDNTLCIFLLGDFFVRLMNAPDKFRFMRYGWFDLLSSIPAFGTGYIRGYHAAYFTPSEDLQDLLHGKVRPEASAFESGGKDISFDCLFGGFGADDDQYSHTCGRDSS